MNRLRLITFVVALLMMRQPVYGQTSVESRDVISTEVTIPPTLSADEVSLLKLVGGGMFYVNGTHTPTDPPEKQLEMLRRQLDAPQSEGQKNIAAYLVFQAALRTAGQALSKQQGALFKEFKTQFYKAQLDAALNGIVLNEVPTLSEFRESAIMRGFGDIGDKARAIGISSQLIGIVSEQAQRNILETIETSMASRLEKTDLSGQGWFTVTPLKYDDVGELQNGVRLSIWGQQVKIGFRHDKPITNVLVVGRVNSTGTALTPEEQRGLASTLPLNHAYGYGDKNKDIAGYSIAASYLQNMSKGRCIYFASLSSGDVIHLPVGFVYLNRLDGGKVSIFCDQGRLEENVSWQ